MKIFIYWFPVFLVGVIAVYATFYFKTNFDKAYCYDRVEWEKQVKLAKAAMVAKGWNDSNIIVIETDCP